MVKKEEEKHFEIAGYVLGILSIVFSVLLQPAFGLGFGITGLILVFKKKSELSKKARTLNVIGIIISIIVLVIISYLLANQILKGLVASAI
mgnify:CR=1 FL=1|tara:strand:+ start:2635 stop:2907 length:273 start_codon:yes stop_codon:yes gene_type:complete